MTQPKRTPCFVLLPAVARRRLTQLQTETGLSQGAIVSEGLRLLARSVLGQQNGKKRRRKAKAVA